MVTTKNRVSTKNKSTEETKEEVEFKDWTETEEVILKRRSIRKYKEKQVPEYLVKRILEAGRFAPSQGNCQPWKFVVVRDKEILDDMEKFVIDKCKTFYSLLNYRRGGIKGKLSWVFAKLMIRIMKNDLHPIPFGAVEIMSQERFRLFHGAPTVIFILMDERGIGKPQVDVGICGENMVLAAHSFGLGTCWVGFVEVLRLASKWKKLLGVEYPYHIIEGITVGYPFGDPDGMIPRDTHETLWIENGKSEIIF